ncbi:unnamed protein product [Arctogadus glacialis]
MATNTQPAALYCLLASGTSDRRTARKVWKERRRVTRPGLDRRTAAAIGAVSLPTCPGTALLEPYSGVCHFRGPPVQPLHGRCALVGGPGRIRGLYVGCSPDN